MALTERTVYDAVTVLEDGQVQVRKARVILDNGVEVARTFHREVLVPGQDVRTLPLRVRAITAAVWTADIVADFRKPK